jgi:predicted NAD-dependent protein-ADP-ribosyltransferase YbiA (DUF1768 family)
MLSILIMVEESKDIIIVETKKEIRFWDPKKDYGFLSNFYGRQKYKPFKLLIDGYDWMSTEHYY